MTDLGDIPGSGWNLAVVESRDVGTVEATEAAITVGIGAKRGMR